MAPEIIFTLAWLTIAVVLVTLAATKGRDIQAWYIDMSRAQRVFVWFLSLSSIVLVGAGILTTSMLIYLQLGASRRD